MYDVATTTQSPVTIPAPRVYQPDDLLTEAEAADYLGVKPRTMRRWRDLRTGPKFIRFPVSRLIRYRFQAILDWVRASERRH